MFKWNQMKRWTHISVDFFFFFLHSSTLAHCARSVQRYARNSHGAGKILAADVR